MLSLLEKKPETVAMSTDYSPRSDNYFDTYSNEIICLNERWHTWFCIYRLDACKCTVSHFYHEELVDGPVRRNAWDSCGYFQRSLKKDFGYSLAVLDKTYQPCFIHYGAFSKNLNITGSNIGAYRRLRILGKRGLFGNRDILGRGISRVFLPLLFPKTSRRHYWNGWGGSIPSTGGK